MMEDPSSQGTQDGTEREDLESDIQDRVPFDPNKIRIRFWSPTLDLILKRIRLEEIDLAPDFQREAGIWADGNQSRLIESMILKIPLPAFYFREQNDESLSVIDGIQRLTACKRFILDGSLRLQGLEYLKELEQKLFVELPRPLQRRLEETSLTVYVVEPGTPEAAALNLFKRINTGGSPLTEQEIRHAMNPGPVRLWLKEMAQSEPFLTATSRSVSPMRMVDRELVARFAAFALTPPEHYERPDLDYFINAAMARLNRVEADRAQLGTRLARSLAAAAALFGDNAFRKIYGRKQGRKPINKALFEAWTVGLDACSDEQLSVLIERREQLLDGFIVIMNDPEFDRAISQGTGDLRKVKRRFGKIRDLIAQVLQSGAPL